MKETTSLVALQSAISRAGSQAALACEIGVTQQAISGALARGRLSAEYVLAAEAATGVSRHDLRPDIYPRDLAPAPPSLCLASPVAGQGATPSGLECDSGPDGVTPSAGASAGVTPSAGASAGVTPPARSDAA